MTQFDDVRERLARIETSQGHIHEMLTEALADLRPRVSKLERRQWMHAGGVGVVTFMLAKTGILPFPK